VRLPVRMRRLSGAGWLPLLLVSFLVLALTACADGSPSTRAVPTPSRTSTTPVRQIATVGISPRPAPVVGLLDAPPTDCPAAPPLHTLALPPDFGTGFAGAPTVAGGAPVWQSGLGTGGVLHLNRAGPAAYPATKVLWLVGPNYPHLVTLSGHDVRSGAPLWFQVYPSNRLATDNPDALTQYTTRAMLDPSAPNRGSSDNSTGHWNIWGIGMFALTAGCYELGADWGGGSWRTILAVGR
jgi:hypothetical protein